jgi:hypothetical protein
MRKAIALLAALVALPSFGAVDTTTISGKVLTPSGDPATAGKVTCELSQAASASDGSGVQRVATRVSATIGATGAVSIAIAPNDTLTPAGTYYTCKFTVTTPASASWVEKWSVASAPDPVDLGSVSRLDVAPGTTTGVYVVALATCSGACPNGGVCIDKDDASTFYCYAGSWTRQDMPPCSPDPPVGPCTDGRLCQASATGFAIYGCYAGDWAAVTGGGGATVAVDGVAVTNSDWVDDGDIDFADTGAGRITGTVQANKVALSTDTTGDYVAGGTDGTGQGLLKTGTEAATLGLIPCGSSQILKSSGSAWACAADDTSAGGTVSVSGTPAANQIGIWATASAMKGAAQLTWDATNNKLVAANQITGTAQYATDLSADGTNCSAGNYPLGVDSKGSVQSCTADDDSPDNDSEVPDAITVSSSGSVAWTALTSYPAACSAGQYVSTIGDTLTCGTPSMSTATTLDADADGTANVTADADSVDFSLDGTGTVARVASDGSYVQVGTTTDGTRGATFLNNTSAGTPAEPAAPASGSTLLYAFGSGALGELYKKNNTDGTSERLILTSGNLAGDVTADATGNVTIGANKILESMLKAVDSATDEECLTYETTTGDFEWQACGSGGGNSFETINASSGTDPVADSATDTLNLTAGSGITITGDSSTDTVTIAATGSTANKWDEVVFWEDFSAVGALSYFGSNQYCPITAIDDSPSGTPIASMGSASYDSATAGTGIVGVCRLENSTVSGEGQASGFGFSDKDMDGQILAFAKMREYRTRFLTTSNFATAATRNMVFAFGGVAEISTTTPNLDYAKVGPGAFFVCASALDLDDDGAADDATEDNDWMFVVSNDVDGTFEWCYTNGAGGCTPDADVTWFDTGVDCTGSGRNSLYYEMDITYDGTSVTGYLDDNDDTASWTWTATTSNCIAGSNCLTTNVPSTRFVPGWGFYEVATGTAPSLPIHMDWLYYKGIR